MAEIEVKVCSEGVWTHKMLFKTYITYIYTKQSCMSTNHIYI